MEVHLMRAHPLLAEDVEDRERRFGRNFLREARTARA
jgi:hypothetical protein